jgi:hypothetical protein
MAKNQTGTFVHVHGEGKPSVAVAPGDDFPSGYDVDSSLTKSQDEAEEVEVAGPSQFPQTKSNSELDKEWSGWKVPELRAALGEGNYEEGDRKDALVSKAKAAGVNPAEKSSS